MNLVDKVFRARIGIEDEGTLSVVGNTTLSSNVTISQGIIANGSIGNASDVLTSNGTGLYWSSSNTKPDAAYTNAVAVATLLAANAFSNAVANASANAALLAANAYANAVANASLLAANAYANAVANAVILAGNAYSNASAFASAQAANAFSNAVANAYANSSNATNLLNGTVPSGRLTGSYTGITEIGAQATANIARVNFSSTGNNYIVYDGSNNFSLYMGNVKVISGNSTVVQIISNNVILDNTTATIKVGYNIAPYNAGTFGPSNTFTPNAALGNYQYMTCNGAITINAPTSDCAIDVLITNGTGANTITMNASAYSVSASIGESFTTTSGNKFLLSVRRINAVSTYSVKALQ